MKTDLRSLLVEIVDNDQRDKKVGEPDHEVADNVHPPMKIRPISTFPAGGPFVCTKQASEEFGDVFHKYEFRFKLRKNKYSWQ
jgi:hypothetical protein